MAIDEALFESVQAGGRPVLRLYRWNPGCLSFGRNQPARGAYDAKIARSLGIDIVRRPTGGLAVYHDRELTYAVMVPVGVLGRPRTTYCTVNRALAVALRTLGISADVSTGVPVAVPSGGSEWTAASRAAMLAPHPCFHEARAGEVTVAGRKLVGSAQRYDRRTILQHGSILIAGDQSEVLRIQRTADVLPDCIGIRDVLGYEPGHEVLCDAIADGFRRTCGIRFDAGAPGDEEETRARALEARYRSDEWTWRQ
jgi:lipoyl(octanoyl) transferase